LNLHTFFTPGNTPVRWLYCASWTQSWSFTWKLFDATTTINSIWESPF